MRSVVSSSITVGQEIFSSSSMQFSLKKRVFSASTQKSSTDYDELQKHLATYFRTDVRLSIGAKGKGKIVLPFANEKELERIIALLDKLRK